jgi:hypothetical protein
MADGATVRQWRERLAWPTGLGILWFVLYTSAVVFDSAWVYSNRNSLAYLFSSNHLSQPLDWLFLLSLLLTLIGVTFRAYIVWAGY